jgi:hypothetical protein
LLRVRDTALSASLASLVSSANVVEHAVRLLIDQSGEQLLRVTENDGPREDLRRAVERAEARNECPAHE